MPEKLIKCRIFNKKNAPQVAWGISGSISEEIVPNILTLINFPVVFQTIIHVEVTKHTAYV